MRKYEKYQSTDIPAIGDIPIHWKVSKLKYLIGINSGDGIKPDEIDFDGSFPVYGGNGIMGYTERFNSEVTDIIIGRVGAKCGNVRLVDGRKWISDNALVAHVKGENDLRFVSLMLDALDLNTLANQNAQPLITGTLVKEKLAAIPPVEEQTAIVEYLDEKTAQIDTLIKKKQKLIELLKEERKAIINQAVSGEGKNWERKKLKYVADRIQTGSTPPSNEEQYFTEEFNWYTPSDFSDSLLLLSSRRKISLEAIKDGVAKVFPENSVLFVGIGATIGKVGYILSPASSNQQINCISFKTKEMAIFYCYWFYAKQNEIIAGANAATLPILNQSQMKDVVVPVPDSTEGIQKTIDQIFKEVTRIEKTIANIGSELALLTEYKTVLISEVVTGKVKVV